MTKQTPTIEVFFNDKEIKIGKLKKELELYLDAVEGLSEDQKNQLKDWYKHEVVAKVRRKEKTINDRSSVEFRTAVLNSVLGEMRGRVHETIRFQTKEKKERLNPQLLTKSATEAYFYTQRAELEKVAEDKKRYLVLANIDLDDFKRVNDDLDHGVGDAVLKAVGQALYESLRPEDKGAHYSGDEFAIILNLEMDDELSEDDVENKAQEILARIVESTQKKAKAYIESSSLIAETIKKKKETNPNVDLETTRELSVGFKIVTKDTEGGFTETTKDADTGANTSKMLRLLSKELSPSHQRIVNYIDEQKIRQRYSEDEWNTAKTKRTVKRALAEQFRELPHEDLMEAVETIIQQLKGKKADKQNRPTKK